MASTGRSSDALLIVDPQVDFTPGGALPVPGGDGIFPVLNRVMPSFQTVVASRDWHPPDHVSFREQGGTWPAHCVRGTQGAALHPDLDRVRVDRVFDKATEREQDAYSAFAGTGLQEWLRDRGVERLYVGGLATDYCVRQSVLDALAAGFQVTVLADAVGAVDVVPGDGDRALAEMQSAGAEVVSSSALVPEGGGDASS